MAEAVTRAHAERRGKAVEVESCGTGDWHAGEPADTRAIEAAAARGYALDGHRARCFDNADFDRFDQLIALDAGHKRWLVTARDARRLPERPISLLLDWSVGLAGTDVPGPYYGEAADFEHALDLIEKGVDGLMRRL